MLRQLIQLSTAQANPSFLTNVLPGGAKTVTAGTSANPFISGPRIEEFDQEVFDCTTSGPTGSIVAAPAIAGKLLTLQPAILGLQSGIPGGATWALNTIPNVRAAVGTYGIVIAPGQASEETVNASAGTGTRALVRTSGPCQAFIATGNTSTTAISAGMPLGSDNAGNLCYAGTSPSSGAVLATALDSMAASVSAPALHNVYVGGY